MKGGKLNIIFLLILSLASFKVNAQEKISENQIGENLKVNVVFTLPEEVVKYSVYVDNDGVIEDVLNLPDFIMSQDSTKAGFVKSPSRVYTKRIVNGEFIDLLTENVTYTLTHADGFMNSSTNDIIKPYEENLKEITSYLPKSTLENIVQSLGKDYVVDQYGNIKKGGVDSSFPKYSSGAMVRMYNDNGVLVVSSPLSGVTKQIPDEDIKKIEDYIGNGSTFANVILKVQID